MFFFKQKGLGIDVCDDAVRVCLLEKKGKDFIPQRLETFRYNPRKYGEDALLEVLKVIKKSFPSTKTIFSIPNEEIYVLKVKGEVEEEIEEKLPVNISEVDYSIRGDFVRVIPKEITSKYSDIAKRSGFKKFDFIPRFDALSKVFEENDKSISVNIGMENTEICMFDNGNVIYSIESRSSSKDIVESIKKLFIFLKINQMIPIYVSGLNVLRLMDEKVWEEISNISLIPLNVWQNCFDLRKTPPPLRREDSFVYGGAIGLALTSFLHKI